MMMMVAMITDRKLLSEIRAVTIVNDRLQCSTQLSKSSQLGFIRSLAFGIIISDKKTLRMGPKPKKDTGIAISLHLLLK